MATFRVGDLIKEQPDGSRALQTQLTGSNNVVKAELTGSNVEVIHLQLGTVELLSGESFRPVSSASIKSDSIIVGVNAENVSTSIKVSVFDRHVSGGPFYDGRDAQTTSDRYRNYALFKATTYTKRIAVEVTNTSNETVIVENLFIIGVVER